MNPIYLQSGHALGPYPLRVTERLDRWAVETPDRTFLAMRHEGPGWKTITYTKFRQSARNVAQALLNRKLNSSTPIAILSGNDFDHAILSMAAAYAGISYAPLSPGYSLLSNNFQTLKGILGLLRPGLIFAAGGIAFAPALRAIARDGMETIIAGDDNPVLQATSFSQLLSEEATADVDEANAKVTGDTIVKILFTSGSAGSPKGVINTHRMMTSNQEMILSAIPCLARTPPILCDWLPWHHTFGGNHNFGLVLYNGGTLYIDKGSPTSAGIGISVRNLNEVPQSVYLNVPRGFEVLLPVLQCQPDFAARFFSQLQLMFCAAAHLSGAVQDQFSVLALKSCGRVIPLITGFGATETAPLTICSSIPLKGESAIGFPVSGVEVKLVPNSGKLELLVRGPNVMPGYFRQPEESEAAFDAEGYFRTGDAVRLANPSCPSQGLILDGRLGEDFKLSTGTWVNVQQLRAEVMLCCEDLVSAVAITGENQEHVGALLFCGALQETEAYDELIRRLKSLAERDSASSRHINRAVFVDVPLSREAGEITEKGSINYGALLQNRAQLVKDLFTSPLPPNVVLLAHVT